MPLIIPIQKNEALLQNIIQFNSDDACRIWWLGQSGFLVKWRSKYLLFDPYLSDSLTHKYQHTDKPHVRMSERVIDPALLNFVDVVTSSHNHTDHLDAETLLPIFQNNPGVHFVIPEANRAFVAERLGGPVNLPVGLNDGLTVDVAGFSITGVPAAHNLLERNEKGESRFMGYVVKFGSFTIYHSGDTLWFDGLDEILKPFQIDIALLPINGNKPERKVAGNLNADEAALLAKTIGAKMTIPHHYHLFQFNTEEPSVFVAACHQHGVPYAVLQLGEGLTYTNT